MGVGTVVGFVFYGFGLGRVLRVFEAWNRFLGIDMLVRDSLNW